MKEEGVTMRGKGVKIIVGLLLLFLLFLPFFLWHVTDARNLDIFVIDKTVPTDDYRKHKGLFWLLNHGKITKRNGMPYELSEDYYGFDPVTRQASQFKIENELDLIYVADTYGVSDADLLDKTSGKRSEVVYGGLSMEEWEEIIKAKSDNTTLIAEFNSIASPTKKAVREQVEKDMGFIWSGWIGRYYADLASDDVPVWLIENYQKQSGEHWNFKSEGIVFAHENGQVIILDRSEFEGYVTFEPTSKGKIKYPFMKKSRYDYWFDIILPNDETSTEANFQINVTELGQEEMDKFGISTIFPAVVHQAHKKTYYFSGDFSDINTRISYRLKGIRQVQYVLSLFSNDQFYWRSYIPLMKVILDDIYNDKTREGNGLSSSSKDIGKDQDIQHVKKREDHPNFYLENGIKMTARTVGKEWQIFQDGKWEKVFWNGVNLGVTIPGHAPGELAPSKEDYVRWFQMMDELGNNLVRIYTILPPHFYEALREHNLSHEHQIYLLHGIWIPEAELYTTRDPFDRKVIELAKKEIDQAIIASYGRGEIAPRPGHASGKYTADISQWLIGWQYGIEWDPQLAKETSINAPDIIPDIKNKGRFFSLKEEGNAFEGWIAMMLDYLAEQESLIGWQHPIGFTNWITTDPLYHPDEPFKDEDLVSIDPNHIEVKEWQAGYFASYHIYPYYPDFIKLNKSYQSFLNGKGKSDPYGAYLRQLRNYHQDLPILVSEFGLPSSRGIAHFGPNGMHHGLHNEEDQAKLLLQMYDSIREQDYNGAILFSWHDEWFKISWNSRGVEKPEKRRIFWHNRLNPEQNYGLIASEAGLEQDQIILDGSLKDWQYTSYTQKYAESAIGKIHTAYNEAYFYLAVEGYENLENKPFTIGFTFDGQGNEKEERTNMFLPKEELKFLFDYQGKNDTKWRINSTYDPNQVLYLYNGVSKDFPVFYQVLNLERRHSVSGKIMPFEVYPIGNLIHGTTDPKAKDYNSLSDFYVKNHILEIRIPWGMLGFTDPSSQQVWTIQDQSIGHNTIHEVSLYTMQGEQFIKVLDYPLSSWNLPNYHERKKKSFYIIQDVFKENRKEENNN
jgi:hypothetical protein